MARRSVTTLACCCCALILLMTSSLSSSWQLPVTASQTPLLDMAQRLYDYMVRAVAEEEGRDDVLELMGYALDVGAQEARMPSVLGCTICTFAVTGLNRILQNNLTYADIRDEVIMYCEDLVFNGTLVGETMCTGLADNYGPELLNIFTIKPAEDANEVCVLWNHCARNDSAQSTQQTKPFVGAAPSPPAKSRGQHERPKRQAANIRIAHMTDIHVEEDYAEGSATDCGLYVCCQTTNTGTGEANYWGNYGCNVPPRTTELFFQYIANMQPPVDFVLYSGDSPPHTAWEETRVGQLAVNHWVADSMYRILPPGTTVYPTIGNHEAYPGNLFYSPRSLTQEFYVTFYNDWLPMTKWGQEQYETIMRAGYYTMLIRPGLRMLAFNSNYGYTFNWYNWVNIDRPEYFDLQNFINNTLRDAELAGEKVILMSHHPFNGGDGIVEFGQFIKAILLRYYETIVLYPFGHTHRDEFILAIDETGEAREVMNGGATGNTQSINNPSMRIYEMDPATFELVDYWHYSLDVEPDFTNASIQLLYSARAEYGLADLSAASWYDLSVRLEQPGQLFDTYYQNTVSGSGMLGDCNQRCKDNHICYTRNVAFDDYENCVGGILP